MTSLAELEIVRVRWSELREIAGTSERIADALRELLASPTPAAARSVYWKLENHVVVSGGLYEAAEPVVAVLLAALADGSPDHVRTAVTELLLQIVSGEPHPDEVARGNDALGERCRQRAREGLWLLYREWPTRGDAKDGAWEVIEAIELDEARLRAFATGR